MNEAQQPEAVAAEAKPFSLTLEKFTKQEVYNLLIGIAQGKSPIQFGSEESVKTFTGIVERNFKPQSGGGKSDHPSHIDPTLQVMVHWCRFLQKYMIEEDMVMSGGKSKGASKLASKHNYELGKRVKELKDEALLLFGAQDYAAGAAKNTEAGEIEASRTKKETYTDEVLAQYLPKPETAESSTVEAPMQAAPVAAPVETQVAAQPVGTLLGHDANGAPVYQQ